MFGPQPGDAVRVLDVTPPATIRQAAPDWPAHSSAAHVEALDHHWSGYLTQRGLEPIVPAGTHLIGSAETPDGELARTDNVLCHSEAELNSWCYEACQRLDRRAQLTVLESQSETALRVRNSKGVEGWCSPSSVAIKLSKGAHISLFIETAEELLRW